MNRERRAAGRSFSTERGGPVTFFRFDWLILLLLLALLLKREADGSPSVAVVVSLVEGGGGGGREEAQSHRSMSLEPFRVD